jgi:LAO/AO transport system kinase
MTLVQDLLAGNRRALARILTLVENGGEGAVEAITALYPHTGRAVMIGVTGAPGTGKSSLVSQMALHLRRAGKTVGILAVDPTSPFSGGAILGDRIRMRDLSGDSGVFIRSMATRGSLGGLARATADALKVLDAAGFDVVLVETVGAGQSEVDIARHAHSIVVVEAPGLGDDVQAIKAGILEIADILVVNKSDDLRAPNTVKALRAMLDLGNARSTQHVIDHHGRLMEVLAEQNHKAVAENDGWQVPIVSTVATEDKGIPDLLAALDEHREYLARSGELAQRQRAQIAAELDALLRDTLVERLLGQIDRAQLGDLVTRVAAHQIDPQSAAHELLRVSG